MSPPDLTVIGGPNGSGKTTLINYLMNKGVEFGQYINADDIARKSGLAGDAGALAAQLKADRMREECLTRRYSFSFETVMSHISKVEFMRRAKAAGYRVTCYFVATGDPDINRLRVQTRVSLGGHDVPKDRILARYHRSIANLPKALTVCDKTVVFDNSALGSEPGDPALRPILKAGFLTPYHLTLVLLPPFPLWALESLRVAQCGFQRWSVSYTPEGFVRLVFRPTNAIAATDAISADDQTVSLAKECLQQGELFRDVSSPADNDS